MIHSRMEWSSFLIRQSPRHTELNQAAENAETEKRMSGFKGPNDKKGVEKKHQYIENGVTN